MACSDISAATFPACLFMYSVQTNHGSSPAEVWISSPTSEKQLKALKRPNQTDLIVRSPIPPLDVWLRSPVSSRKSSDCSFATGIILKSTTVVYFPSPQFVELFVKQVSINLYLPVCFSHDDRGVKQVHLFDLDLWLCYFKLLFFVAQFIFKWEKNINIAIYQQI